MINKKDLVKGQYVVDHWGDVLLVTGKKPNNKNLFHGKTADGTEYGFNSEVIKRKATKKEIDKYD